MPQPPLSSPWRHPISTRSLGSDARHSCTICPDSVTVKTRICFGARDAGSGERLPLRLGMCRSRMTTSGLSSLAFSTASRPSPASPHTCHRNGSRGVRTRRADNYIIIGNEDTNPLTSQLCEKQCSPPGLRLTARAVSTCCSFLDLPRRADRFLQQAD